VRGAATSPRLRSTARRVQRAGAAHKVQEEAKADVAFAEDPPRTGAEADRLLLDIAGYAGPLDLLLDLAKAQKVDLRHISILALVRQYLAFVERAKALELTLAADYLVMAAWLAYLKSRLLLPAQPEDEGPGGEELAELLAFRLRQLEAVQKAAKRLAARPRAYAPGFVQEAPARATRWTATLGDLLAAYGATLRRGEDARYDPPAYDLACVDEAAERVTRLLRADAWLPLMHFVPRRAEARGALYARSALAATLAAALELTRQGAADMQQDAAFAPVRLRAARRGTLGA
jgi:segregation and condensation protein A